MYRRRLFSDEGSPNLATHDDLMVAAAVGYLSGLVLFVLPLVTQPAGLVFPAWVFIVSVVLLATRFTDATIEPDSDDLTVPAEGPRHDETWRAAAPRRGAASSSSSAAGSLSVRG